MEKLPERLFGRNESYDDIARKLALEDKDVSDFLDSHKSGYSLSVSGIGGKRVVEYLSKNHHHPELAPYAYFPERLLCVLVDSREAAFGIPERDVMRVYVDIEEKKVVARDTLKWERGSVSGRARVVKA